MRNLLLVIFVVALAGGICGAVVVNTQQPGQVLIQPDRARVLVGTTLQFRVVGYQDAVTWTIVDSSAEGVGTIDYEGLFTALSGGWVIIGVASEAGETLATTDTVRVLGGPSRVDRLNGRVFAASDTFVVVYFPEQARERAMTVLIERRGTEELPAEAQGKGTAVAVFIFTAFDAETGEDVGAQGFGAKAQLTLHYGDEDIPEGVDEEDLVAAFFDEGEENWEEVPDADVAEVDLDANLITVETDHTSYWGVLDVTSLVTPVPRDSWGRIKGGPGW